MTLTQVYVEAGLSEATQYARMVARLAIRSLYAELTLYPKPGLVSLVDKGSHSDMDRRPSCAVCSRCAIISTTSHKPAVAAPLLANSLAWELRQGGACWRLYNLA